MENPSPGSRSLAGPLVTLVALGFGGGITLGVIIALAIVGMSLLAQLLG